MNVKDYMGSLCNYSFTNLYFSQKLTSLEGIECFPNLEKITFENTGLTNLKGLEELQKLKVVCIDEPSIYDISVLDDLPKLTHLTFNNVNFCGSLHLLDNLINLKHLGLKNAKISEKELFDLYKFKKLQSLNISNNSIKSLYNIRNFVNLKHLFCNNNLISDLTPLSNLTNLSILDISQNYYKDLLPLKNLINLDSVIIDLKYNIPFYKSDDFSYLIQQESKIIYYKNINKVLFGSKNLFKKDLKSISNNKFCKSFLYKLSNKKKKVKNISW